MKKILSILSVLTITGTAMPNVIAASNYEKPETNFKIKQINRQINYTYNDWYGGFFTEHYVVSDNQKILNWKKYAKTWDEFIDKYSSFKFDNDSFFKISLSNGWFDSAKLNVSLDTKSLKGNSATRLSDCSYIVSKLWNSSNHYSGTLIQAYLNIWHENNFIYFKWILKQSSNGGYNTYFDIKLNNINFN